MTEQAPGWLYPDAVRQVRQACAAFLSGDADIPRVQAALRQAEQTIVAHDEKWLRALLGQAENRLEEIQYTLVDPARAAAARDTLQQVLRALDAHDAQAGCP